MPRPDDQGPGIPQAAGYVIGAPPAEAPASPNITPEMASAQAFIPPIQDQQGSGEQDVIRWGDQQTLEVPFGGDVTSNQLVQVNRLFAETWTLFLFAQIQSISPPSSGASFFVEVKFQIILGVGAAQVSLAQPPPVTPLSNIGVRLLMNSAAPAPAVEDYLSITTPYATVFKTLELPAKALQVIAAVGSGGIGQTVQVQMGAFAAPRVLQPALMQLPPSDAGGGGQKTEWMPPGFYPEPVHYR